MLEIKSDETVLFDDSFVSPLRWYFVAYNDQLNGAAIFAASEQGWKPCVFGRLVMQLCYSLTIRSYLLKHGQQ
jgi:hypothetical protein